MLSFHKNYVFIKHLLKNAFKVNVKLLKAPYSSLIETDYGLRKMFWKDFNYNDEVSIAALQQLPPNQITCLNSKLGFTTFLYRVPNDFEDCTLFIGPFLSEELTNDFISKILNVNHFPISAINAIQNYYQTLPYVDYTTIISTLETLLAYLIPKFVPDNIATYNFSDINEISFAPEISASQNFVKQFYNDYVSAHNAVFQQIGQDNYEELSHSLNHYLQISGLLNESNIQHIKHILHKFNIKCEFVVLQKKVHYIYIERVYISFSEKIRAENSRDRLLLLPQQMIHKYSLIVRNHSLEQYSHTIRNAINYINLNLQEPLSLSYVAEQINKNASFLSNQFKKETGQTITNFIHDCRIEQAIRLLNTSNLSVQEIAERVGILELNYFSKLFKKKVGMSPTEYKKLIK